MTRCKYCGERSEEPICLLCKIDVENCSDPDFCKALAQTDPDELD